MADKDPLGHKAHEFKRLDKNGDGVLTLDELFDGMRGRFEQDEVQQLFEVLDSNSDGKITLEEFLDNWDQATLDKKNVVAICGATGMLGTALVKMLAGSGIMIRACCREPESTRAQALSGLDNVVLVKADMNKPETLRAAFFGVRTVVCIVPGGLKPPLGAGTMEEAQQCAKHVMHAALNVGAHIVMQSSMAATVADGPLADEYLPLERFLIDSKAAFTILRAALFMENNLMQAQSARESGTFGGAVPADTIVPHLALSDYAECLSVVIKRPSAHDGKIYSCQGTMESMNDLVREVSELLGYKISYAQLPMETVEAMYSQNVSPWMIKSGMQNFKNVIEGNSQALGLNKPSQDVDTLLGHPCKRYRSWVQETSAAWRGIKMQHVARDDGTQVPVYVSPDVKQATGVICVQEWWGINPQIQKTAGDFSTACGARVAVPDLFRSKIAYEASEANHLMSGLDWMGAIGDIRACAKFLKSSGCKTVFVSGFCMGGALALGSAVQVPEIDGCIAFYGWNNGLGDAATMKKPTQCHFGDKDDIVGFSDKGAADKLEAALKKSGCPLEFYRYPSQGHGFMNSTDWGMKMQAKLGRPEIEVKEIETAMERVKAFVAKYGISL